MPAGGPIPIGVLSGIVTTVNNVDAAGMLRNLALPRTEFQHKTRHLIKKNLAACPDTDVDLDIIGEIV